MIPEWISLLNIQLSPQAYISFGTVGRGHRLQQEFLRAGLSNHKEKPLCSVKNDVTEDPNISILRFSSTGMPLSEWEKRRDKIETALNLEIADIRPGKDKRTIWSMQ